MKSLLRWSAIVLLALLVPIIPFLAYGTVIEGWVRERLAAALSPASTAACVVGALASDVFLPVPSSAVSTFAGQRLGFLWGTIFSWLGMMVGSLVAFSLARYCGRPLAARWAPSGEWARAEALSERFGSRLILLTRAVPVLAEAAVLVLGVTRLEWRRFLAAATLGNLCVSSAYAALGAWSRLAGAELAALTASIILPLGIAAVANMLLPGTKRVL